MIGLGNNLNDQKEEGTWKNGMDRS